MNTVNDNNEIVISICKNFIVEEVSKFRDELLELMKKGKKNFMLDFSNCEFIDSTGLGVIVSIYKKCKEENGNIKLQHVKPQVMKVFELTRLDKVLEIH